MGAGNWEKGVGKREKERKGDRQTGRHSECVCVCERERERERERR